MTLVVAQLWYVAFSDDRLSTKGSIRKAHYALGVCRM
jgi:hypothetical protein